MRHCIWCNTPIEPGHEARIVGGEPLHLEPTAPCVLEYAHDAGDVDLLLNAALALVARLTAGPDVHVDEPSPVITDRRTLGTDLGPASGEWCAGSPTG